MKLFVAGRYNKYSRRLPQTPWILGGGRMAELSVDELITMHLRYLFQADSTHILLLLSLSLSFSVCCTDAD